MINALPANHGVCLTFGEASSGTSAIAEEWLRAGGAVMCDNGAYSAFKRGERMDLATAWKVLGWYERFAAVGGDLMIVAPDVVGDCLATRQLQLSLAPRLRELARSAKVIVPVQGRDIGAAADGWRDAVELIGPDSVVAGIPSSKATWTADEVRAFVHATGARRVHFLGGSSKARREIASELRLEASSDSGFAVIKSINTPGRMKNLARFAAESERRVAGVGARFAVAGGQTRWPWAWRDRPDVTRDPG